MKIRHINIIMHKELSSYTRSAFGTIFIVVFLVTSSWLFFQSFFLMNQSTMRDYFSILPWLFLFLLPAITMRLWAEEKKMGTLELLLTSPLTSGEVVWGKFLASLGFLTIALILSGVIPVILFLIGQPDFGPIVGGYMGAFFLGAAYIAIGLFISGLTDNQIVAFILSVSFILVLLAVGNDLFLNTVPESILPFLKSISLKTHFESIVRGVLDSRDFVYYGLFVLTFLYLNIFTLNHRKWR
ncbi:ABC transporter [Candidatus Peregrinibacteria bacterium CG_4_10_14_0_2_um_filter_43_11]|nr:MAG: ABC transporter [Candidatus Peregrinibacteria bacterium CG_4_10_14_0_2_um_filter_43_11]